MFKRKSVVLSDTASDSNKKAVMSLEEDEVGVRGTLRLYNFSSPLDGISSLGFYVQQKVYKAGLTYKSPMLYEFFVDLKEIPQKFSCAVVNFQNAVAKPVLFGSSEGSEDDVYGNIIAEISKDNTLKNAEKVLDTFGVDYDDKEKEEIEKDIDEALCQGDCANCVYKKYFYENVASAEAVDEIKNTEESHLVEEEPETKEDEETEIIFIDKLKPQIDRLFENNPVEDKLQQLIPDSKFVKVEYEDDGDFYVFGLLYDENQNIKYVCYGVPAIFEQQPPKELSGYPIWLPLDKQNAQGFGYWLTYQDAVTGEPIRAVLD
ncbi:MAG: hypothetical protein ACI4R8_00265 [Candidatus Caccovivens sp.]